jgi:hypothetical protein
LSHDKIDKLGHKINVRPLKGGRSDRAKISIARLTNQHWSRVAAFCPLRITNGLQTFGVGKIGQGYLTQNP